MGVKQPTHSICPIYVISGSTRLPDKVTASGFVASQVDGAQVGGWPAALMAELPAKEERWRQLGYANHRDWRLAVEKQRRDAARAARIDSGLPNGAAPSPAGVASAPAPVVPTRKRRSNHPPSTTGVLCKWFDDHRWDPYPSPKEKGVRCGFCRAWHPP